MTTLKELQERLEKLDKRIQETKKRLPAHSVKPPIMMELLALEDEYAELSARIAAFLKDQGGPNHE